MCDDILQVVGTVSYKPVCGNFTKFSTVMQGPSVRAAAAGIIAADFTAAPTDSPLQVALAQRLPAASQWC